jgi:uncharacterized RDD family membrane protein YckC
MAGIIDYATVMLYGTLVFLLMMAIFGMDRLLQLDIDPFEGQLIGFFTMTLPTFLYFYLSEKGKKKGTIGKRLMSIRVDYAETGVLLRNVGKLLPWEIAHSGVHWMYYFDKIGSETLPIWAWVLVVLPQLTVLYYYLTIIVSKGKQAAYDQLAGTKIVST